MYRVQNISRTNAAIAISASVVLILLGLVLIKTKAASSFFSIEAEQGTVSGSVTVGSDAAASGGKYAQFGAPTTTPTTPTPTTPATADLTDPRKKETAMILVSTAENSSMDWRAQYGYIEYNVEGNAAENRGYTGGIIGFTSKTHDMLELVQYYQTIAPGNVLAKYIPALQKVDGTSSSTGLGAAFIADWKTAAKDAKFQQAQTHEQDRVYFTPAVSQAKADGLHALGQFDYYDAMVVHGPGSDALSFGGIRAAAMKKAKTPAQGGDEKTYLAAWQVARKAAMTAEEGHSDVTRIDTLEATFLNAGNLNLNVPLSWKVYGDSYSLSAAQLDNYIKTGKF